MTTDPKSRERAFRDGASIAVFDDRRRVLLVKRARPPFAGLWSLPGGKLEPGESAREAVTRELTEETGISADIDGVLDVISVAAEDWSGGRTEYRITVFYSRYAGGGLKAAGDAERAEWIDLHALGTLSMTEGTADLIRLAARRLEGV